MEAQAKRCAAQATTLLRLFFAGTFLDENKGSFSFPGRGGFTFCMAMIWRMGLLVDPDRERGTGVMGLGVFTIASGAWGSKPGD